MARDLAEEVNELNRRIGELEGVISALIGPVQRAQESASRYYRLLEILLEHGGLTPEAILPEVKNPISQDLVRILLAGKPQNISQLTEVLRERRGSASRRIVRDRLAELAEAGMVIRTGDGAITTYSLSRDVLSRWSQLLGIDI